MFNDQELLKLAIIFFPSYDPNILFSGNTVRKD